MNAGIIVAAGSAKRLKSKINKPYLKLNNDYIINFSLKKFLQFSNIQVIVIVYRKKDKNILQQIIKNYKEKKIIITVGGKERYNSVFNGLKVLQNYKIEKVFIHDAARPFISLNLLNKLYKCSLKNSAVVPALKPADTIKEIYKNKIVKQTVNRNNYRLIQTPQVFDYNKLFNIYKKNKDWTNITDDAALFEKEKEKVKIINGEKYNIKITDKFDLLLAQKICELL
ncbi:MAG TPA: 2-C-methyl-D-erythritol 4-phosphate cytidylyltransferase [bacterium]|nr:2-C-methyl-D-erythritol 4-phosphate cytidylyltransferase [bacterium]HOL48527.1 2-C-methyl-D-erythritol 4-phosphate cytidylyltransferase [bacterium]HPQ19697.1 2-C-methyl-D-erythritol 4-phosphate cytidylyltransferase [bacterium]